MQKVKVITQEEAYKEGLKRFKGKNFQQMKARIFSWGAMWAMEQLFNYIKDKPE